MVISAPATPVPEGAAANSTLLTNSTSISHSIIRELIGWNLLAVLEL
jgi:hypothetical protein